MLDREAKPKMLSQMMDGWIGFSAINMGWLPMVVVRTSMYVQKRLGRIIPSGWSTRMLRIEFRNQSPSRTIPIFSVGVVHTTPYCITIQTCGCGGYASKHQVERLLYG
jgi:hypothetical protein